VGHSVCIPWSTDLADYDFGPQHPLSPVRVQLAMELIKAFGLLDAAGIEVIGHVAPVDDDTLLQVHTPALLRAVKRGADDPGFTDLHHGLGTADTPVFPDMHAAAARVCGATLAAVRAVYHGRTEHAVNIAGGLHHAMPDRSSGFCVYNDLAVAIRWLLGQGVERVAYLDLDVHHGDGVQAAFWDDPRVLTVSIHESPMTLFPGTGWAGEIGGPRALGTAVNIAVPAGTGDQGWLRALHAVVPDVIAEFRPQFIVSQHGCDSHFSDPLANLAVSLDGQRMAAEAVHRWAHRFADGNWVATGGGGYEWLEVVPRSWTHLFAIAAGRPIPPDTPLPARWREYAGAIFDREAPESMTDGYEPWPKNWSLGYNPADPLDAAVMATRHAVFPYLGLASDGFGGF
jgi:acetoin utilization protein AcuC